MTEYYIYKTKKRDRWDSIATTFYGNCFEFKDIIEANPHVPIAPTLEADIEIRIPIKEAAVNLNLPIWKQ